MKRILKWLLGLLCGLLAGLALALFFVLRALQPAPGEWTRLVQLGPFQREISMPAVLRIASHPFTLHLMAGRSFRTPYGTVHWQAVNAPNTWRAVCAPCTLPVGGLGREPLRLSRVEFTVVPDMQMNLQGHFALGEGAEPLQGRWSSRIERQQLVLQFRIADEPAVRAFALFQRDIPEFARARIDGRVSVKAQWRWPAREWEFKPRLDGLRVSGLGTEVLLNAQPACGRDEGDAERPDFGPWLPRAVVAAEDQRYYEHPGYDLQEIVAAWFGNQRDERAVAGGSTLAQQLAKLLYTGDSRHHGRKLRELLYAVELDRTLGKPRLLNLYLALAPWGDGQCGAQAAARHFFRKDAAHLTPVEAVWLATLLHNPDRELAQMGRHGDANRARVAWVADQLRPVTRGEREALVKAAERWRPPAPALRVAMAVAASQAAQGR
ncbi:biosynthetic peptidoglycan transglycosylase [Piscinibacter sp. HJYY11]|uniref:biosynthetic peptidoglycan transglycosylase n=1 Tax=Piscinibacter sp. HJYY11 TaxID=2801333 RepID=UPI00191FD96B|nr:biosynthetic peptidoglycan transglycosylase [Piscinibacter sp. HJYY11]MBL0729366.1 transglycosylase domain-containing protein [Piscinibacter sp. HJYY11]